ncbi:hypothetical protein J7J18_03650 [bacterium]|nr:hypothetical protein [bacterium]
MKCPSCGLELDEVDVEESAVVSIRIVYKRDEEGCYKYYEEVDRDTMESQIEAVRCPECGAHLKWRYKNGKIILEEE